MLSPDVSARSKFAAEGNWQVGMVLFPVGSLQVLQMSVKWTPVSLGSELRPQTIPIGKRSSKDPQNMPIFYGHRALL